MTEKDFSNPFVIRIIARDCVRNTFLEDLHAGKCPADKNGDYSNTKVITTDREIPWNEVSRISDKEMRKLMLEVEDKLFAVLSKGLPELFKKIPNIHEVLEDAFKNGVSWDCKDFKKR